VLSGEVKEVRTGVSAIDYRAELLAMQAPQRVQKMESFLSTFLTGFTLREYKVENLEDFDKELVVNYSFVAMNYAKTVGGLLLIRPRIFGSKAEGLIDLKERKYPVEMEATAIHSDEFNITLPMGFTVDELPAPVKIVSGPISYSSESVLNGTTLKYNRQYKVEQVMVPLEGLEELNRVNRKIAQDERNSAVLKRQP
jgi:hypothetical protein